MVYPTEDVDGEHAAAWYLQRRMGDLRACFSCYSDGRLDIVNQPVRAHRGLLAFMHRRPHSNQAAIFGIGRSSISKFGYRLAKLDTVSRSVCGANRINICRHDFEIVNSHCILHQVQPRVICPQFYQSRGYIQPHG